MKDYYKILGVDKKATTEKIKKAFRKKAVDLHPDKTNGDKEKEEQFKEINEAYEVLSDENKRKNYDTFGTASPSNGQTRSGPSFSSIFQHSPFEDAINLDIKFSMAIRLEEVVSGTVKKIKYSRSVDCADCKSKGYYKDEDISQCSYCGGKGKIQMSFPNNMLNILRSCHLCNGNGFIINNACKSCNGNGIKTQQQEIKLKIPIGIAEGTRLVSKSMGNGMSGQIGDLVVRIVYDKHPIFNIANSLINSRDVYFMCTVPLHIAIVGGEIEVPTLHGISKLKIEQGAQTNQKVLLPNKGLPTNKGSVGDQINILQIEIPSALDESAKEALKKIPLDRESYPVYFSQLDINDKK